MILLYTEEAEISDDSRAALIAAGMIPIKVADKEAVKMLPLPAPLIEGQSMDAIFRAAMVALVKSTAEGSSAAKYFGLDLAKALSKAPEASRQEGS